MDFNLNSYSPTFYPPTDLGWVKSEDMSEKKCSSNCEAASVGFLRLKSVVCGRGRATCTFPLITVVGWLVS